MHYYVHQIVTYFFVGSEEGARKHGQKEGHARKVPG